jgi:hypothetical protein
MYRLLTIGCALAIVCNGGCGSEQKGAAPAAQITGTVTLDGNPVPAGEIHLGMAGVPPRVLQIKDGAFSGEAPIGKNQVEIFIYEEGPPSEKRGGARSKKNIAPEKYWGQETVLEATVEAGGTNEFKFTLTSK